MGAADEELQPHVIAMNHRNSIYKEASKHVKIHAAPPKPKGQAKPKAAAAKAKAAAS